MDSSDWLMLLSLILLLGLSAYFSMSETAFSTVNRVRLKNYAENGDPRAKRALKITGRFEDTLSTVLIGNNLVNITSTTIAATLATRYLGSSGPVISTVVMTLLVLTFGEILPKAYAKENSERVALGAVGFLRFCVVLLRPLSFLFAKLQGAFSKLTRREEEEKIPTVTEEELKYIIESIEEEGVLEEQESDLVQSALELDEITVQEVLTPRVDVVAVDVDDPVMEVRDLLFEEKFSRIPVYEGSIDNCIGILYSWDFIVACVKQKAEDIKLRDMLSEPYFVHKTMRLSSLLSQFKLHKQNMAVVTDDYGGMLGVVTMEDILEQLVGEIWDEDEEATFDIVKVGDNEYEVSGDLNIYEMLEEMDYDDRDFESDYNTVNGWALEQLERIPDEGDAFSLDGLTCTVKEMDGQRIKTLLVRLDSAEEEKKDS